MPWNYWKLHQIQCRLHRPNLKKWLLNEKNYGRRCFNVIWEATINHLNHFTQTILHKGNPNPVLAYIGWYRKFRSTKSGCEWYCNQNYRYTEAAHQRRLLEKVFWKYATNLQESTHTEAQSNFIEIALRHEGSRVNLVHILKTSFPKNTLGLEQIRFRRGHIFIHFDKTQFELNKHHSAGE